MMRELGLEMLVVVALSLANAFFSGGEIAILAVRKTRLRELAEQGHRSARVALHLRENPERFLATVQVGITVLGASAGAFGGAVLERPIAALLRGIGFGNASDDVAFFVVVAFISVVSIVVGELVPKSLALRSSERVALWVSGPLYWMARGAWPIVWFLTAASNLLLRPFRDQTTFVEARLSPEELQQVVDEAAEAGTLDKEAGDIASRAIDLGKLKAFSVMVPRGEIAGLASDATRSEVERTLRDRPHARYPVFDPADQAVGYVVAHELYGQLLDGTFDLPAILREIPSFPESAPAVEILRALQRARSEIGLVVDDGGLPSGLVSIETLAEELFGEIVAEDEIPRDSIVPQPDGSSIVRGDTPVHEINRKLGFDLPVQKHATTIGGLLLSVNGALPTPGSKLVLPGGVTADVKDVSARRVLSVRLQGPRKV
jgi:putative hemolysin